MLYGAGATQRKARGLTPDAVHWNPNYGVGTTESMRSQGGYGVTLECGQHDDPEAPEVAYTAICHSLALLGLGELALAPAARPFECLALTDVVDRHAESDHFVKPWISFDPLTEGELIALRVDGSELGAQQAGYIVLPDASALPGHEWFYRAVRSERPP